MDKTYWDLFWTTGLPEAWLMSRGGAEPVLPGGVPSGVGQGQFAPLTGFPPRVSEESPEGPQKLY